MAAEKVYIISNTSVIHDEILAHRLGLIPIYADPFRFQYKTGESSDTNTIVFALKSQCTSMEEGTRVISKDLKWVPQGKQDEVFRNDPIRPVHDDILIAKLRPGQEIILEMHCEKNIGKEHAKWSPVSLASYRLLPEITMLQPITGNDAVKFASCFPEGVIVLEKVKGIMTAKVGNPRKDTVSRECLRHAEFADKVKLGRRRDHFIFSIESIGVIKPAVLVDQSLQTIIDKCDLLGAALDEALRSLSEMHE